MEEKPASAVAKPERESRDLFQGRKVRTIPPKEGERACKDRVRSSYSYSLSIFKGVVILSFFFSAILLFISCQKHRVLTNSAFLFS